jgi:hypothetical protein
LRWKLLVVTSLAAAVAGAGGSYGLIYTVLYVSRQNRPSTFTLFLLAEVFPVAASIFAGIFVYRHTARRRKLQVFLTVLLTLTLSQALIRFVMSFVPFFPSHD